MISKADSQFKPAEIDSGWILIDDNDNNEEGGLDPDSMVFLSDEDIHESAASEVLSTTTPGDQSLCDYKVVCQIEAGKRPSADTWDFFREIEIVEACNEDNTNSELLSDHDDIPDAKPSSSLNATNVHGTET